MALLAYDGASAFDLNVAKQYGGIAIADYLVGHPGGYDPANEARVAHTRFLGMGPIPNWERAAGFFNACTVAEARTAGAEGAAASRALGFPADGSIRVYFSFDEYVTGARFVEMGQKFDAVRAGCVGYQAAVYGQYPLINYLVTTGHAPGKHWLSGSTFNEPYNPSGPNIAMVQSHDAAGNWINTQVPGTDVNTVIDPHALGAWWPAGSPYASTTTTASGEASMIYIKAPTGGIGVLAGGGKYHFTPAEWTAHSAVRNALPAAVRDTVAPFVSITDAQWNALPEYRDDLAEVTNAIAAADTDLTAKIAAAGQNNAQVGQILAVLADTDHGLAALAALVRAVQIGGGADPLAIGQAIAAHLALTTK